ncbi:MAG: glycoside hydrolase [Flavobacteriales bacterium]|nr:glycoside hydrolase [Flavobacteriales bacterium]
MILSLGCGQVISGSQDSSSFRVIGYYLGPKHEVENFEYQKLTHIVFCFTQLDGNKIAFEDSLQGGNAEAFGGSKEKYPHLKVMVALGGWSGCQTCSSVFSSETDRQVFAKSVKELLIKYDLDGFDLDWESQVMGGKYGPGKPEDKTNFTSLIKTLRQELPPPYELSFDANSFPEYVQNSLMAEVMPHVDFVNLMTYGLPNDKRAHTGHHAALYSSPFQKESVASGVELLDSLKVPMNKIVIGAGFYGFVVKDVDAENHGLGQKGKSGGDVKYKDIVVKYTPEKGFITYWDSIAKAPFRYNAEEKIFITYDNAESCRLKRVCHEKEARWYDVLEIEWRFAERRIVGCHLSETLRNMEEHSSSFCNRSVSNNFFTNVT